MRAGVLSDTHIPDVTNTLPHQVKEAFSNVDLILHAGDIYSFSVLDELERLAPVMAARGDDDYSIPPDQQRFKEKHILNLEGVRLWLCHVNPLCIFRDWILRSDYDPPELQDIDVMVFGHTHRGLIDNYKGVLLVNPGSPTFPDYVPTLGTVAILTLTAGEVEARLLQLY